MARGIVVECGMDALGVVVFDVFGDSCASGGEVFKPVLPGALFFEGADEALAEPILFGCVGGDVFLCQPVVAHECSVSSRAEDKAIVMSQGESLGSTSGGTEAAEQSLFECTLGGFGTGSVSQFPAKHFARAAVDDWDEGAPAIDSAVYGGDVSGPTLIGGLGNGLAVQHARPQPEAALATSPAMQLHDAVDFLAIDPQTLPLGEVGVNEAHSIGWVGLDDVTHGFNKHGITLRLDVASAWLVVARGAGHAEQSAELGDGHFGAGFEQIVVHGYQEIPSGKSLPCKR